MVGTGLPPVLRWPVAHAIVLGLFLVGALVGWVTWLRFQTVPRYVERGLNEHSTTLALQGSLLEADQLVRNYLAAGEVASRDELLGAGNRLRTLVAAAEGIGQEGSDGSQRLMTASRRGLDWYREFAEPAVRLMGDGRQAEAAQALAAGQKTLDSVTNALSDLATEQARDAEDVWSAATRLGRSGTPILIGTILIALLMALLAVNVLGRVTERAMRRRTELALVVDAMPYGFVELDAELSIHRITRRAAQLFGLERRGLRRTPFASLFVPEHQERVEAHLRDVQGLVEVGRSDTVADTGSEEDRAEVEAGVRRTDNTAQTVVVLAAPLAGQGDRLAVIVRDVTAERLVQERLRQSERLSTIGTLAAGVAHELNNPLAAIATFTHTIDTSQLSSEDLEAVQAIGHEAQRAGGIVRNLLGFARRRQAERKPVSIVPIVERVVTLRRYEFRKDSIDLEVDCPSELPLFIADEQQMQQVILNLVVNAHHAMLEQPTEGRRLTIRARGGAASGLTVAVEDTGPGIPAEILGRLFEPFFTTKTGGAGTGLGLSVSHGIIGEHGGRIWAENREEGGARFVIELSDVVEPSASPQATAAARPLIEIGSQRILVADDDEGNRRALQRVLKQLGHVVETAVDGRSALERLAQNHFDIVISDLHMPGMSGPELFRAVESERPELAKRFLFMSGDTVSQEARTFLETVGQPALRKPYEIEELQQVLARLASGDVRARASSAWSVLA